MLEQQAMICEFYHHFYCITRPRPEMNANALLFCVLILMMSFRMKCMDDGVLFVAAASCLFNPNNKWKQQHVSLQLSVSLASKNDAIYSSLLFCKFCLHISFEF